MRKKILSLILCFCLIIPCFFVLTACGDEPEAPHEHTMENGICTTCHYGAVARIGDNYFTSLKSAVEQTEAQELPNQTTIYVLSDIIDGGIDFGDEFTRDVVNLVVDFGGHSYTFGGEMVGSPNTTTNGFRLLIGSKLTLKNGTIKLSNTQGENTAKMLINNYGDLVLDNFTVDARTTLVALSGSNYGCYAISNNHGSLTLKGNSHIIARDNVDDEIYCAFDLWYGSAGIYKDRGVAVTFGDDFTGSVKGRIEYGSAVNDEGWEDKTKLEIKKGNFILTAQDGETPVFNITKTEQPNIVISGGTFNIDVSNYVADGYECVEDGQVFVVRAIED